jgi:arylsulfatase A-like enzyme
MLENSLLIFCSDHGEMLGDHELAYKWLMYDAVVHIPLIIRYPGSTDAPDQVEDLVSLIDLGPTVLEAAGVPIPTYMEGRSLIPYLKSEEIEPREFVVAEDNYLVMMRTSTHKLVYYIGQEQGELYDLERDPGELHNLWSDPAHTQVKNGLLLNLLDWMATSNYYNSGYKRGRQRQYPMPWPTGDVNQNWRRGRPKQVDYL